LSDSFFRVEMLPALHGDALWIEYGNSRQKRRILIDGGPIGAYSALENKLKTLPEDDKRIELLVITHVDTDHIEGIIRLLGKKRSRWLCEPADIWFNGWQHLQGGGVLGGKQGDFLSALIKERAPAKWNRQFAGQPVVVKPEGPLPVIKLNDGFEDGMKLTLLSPAVEQLKQMDAVWAKDVKGKHLLGDLEKALEQLFSEKKYHAEGVLGAGDDSVQVLANQLKIDQSVANGTSLAFLAEFGDKSCLFLGDAHPAVICQSIRKLLPDRGSPLKVDAVKMAHHGSQGNISEDLLKMIEARHYLFSTNGAIFKHPDRATIEAVVERSAAKPTLWFNYESEFNSMWKRGPQAGQKEYTACYPPAGQGIVAEL
jgi:beta-lactamase superfamily II metal-dependent hydrolase